MNVIHKIAAMVIENNSFLMVRKKGASVWTNLGGKPEGAETEEETLLREIHEEAGCDATIVKKLGDFEAPAAEDDAIVILSTYLVKLHGAITLNKDEFDDSVFIRKTYKKDGYNLPPSIEKFIIPFCVREGLLEW